MKLVITDHHHNIFHWLTVVFIKTVSFLIISPVAIYTAAVGAIIFKKTIEPFPPSVYLNKITSFITPFPYLSIIKNFITEHYHWYKEAPTWWAMTIGVPLILVGSSIFLINCFNLFFSIFSLHYNRTHCPFCKEPIKIKHR